MACDVCAHDFCNRNCLCWFCGDGPGCHDEDCPEDAKTEEEYARRIELPKWKEKCDELDEAVAGMEYQLEMDDYIEVGRFAAKDQPTSKPSIDEDEWPFN